MVIFRLVNMPTSRVVVFGAILTTMGCTATVDDVTVGVGEPGERLSVTAEITKNQTTIQGVELQTRAVGGNFGPAAAMTGSIGNYSGQTPRQGPGDYEARVTVRYLRVMLPGEQTRSRTETFSLNWPPGTFGFENGLQGWTYQGVDRTSDDFQQCDAATLTSYPYFSWLFA